MARSVACDLDFGSASRLRNLPAPANTDEPARLADLNAAIEGLKNKESAFVAAQGNVNLSSPGATIDGQTPASGSRTLGSVLLRFQTTASENGLYLWNGASSAMTRASDANSAAELTNAVVAVQNGTDAGKAFRQTTTLAALGTDAVTWTAFGTGASAATTSSTGTVQLATQTEVNTGTDANKAVTPATLAGSAWAKRKFTATFGDGSNTQYDLTHNYGTRDVQVAVYRNGSPYDVWDCEVQMPDVNTVRLKFAVAPASNQLNAVIIG